MPDARTEEIRARHEAASPGSWCTSRDLNGTYTIKHGTRITREEGFGSDGDVAVLVGDEQTAYRNGTFIAHAREDVPYLLDRVAELEARLRDATASTTAGNTLACSRFPNHCPNVRTVPADPPTHHGGIRCGCADVLTAPKES